MAHPQKEITMFYKWLYWKIMESGMLPLVEAYLYTDSFEEWPPSYRDQLYYEIADRAIDYYLEEIEREDGWPRKWFLYWANQVYLELEDSDYVYDWGTYSHSDNIENGMPF